MHYFRQFLAMLKLNLSSIPRRIAPVLTIVVGVTCAVGALVSMLAMGTGARQQEIGDVRADRVVLNGADAQKDIPRDEGAAIRDLPGIRRGADGEPTAILQSLVPLEGRRRITGNRIFFPLIGVSSGIVQLQPEMRFTEGRMFQRGLHEFIVSNPCVRQFSGFETGAQRSIHGGNWTVVGRFDLGSTQQCVVYADVDSVNSTFARSSYDRVMLMLRTPADYAILQKAVGANPALHLQVRHEKEAVEEWFKSLNVLLNFVSFFVGAIMAVGATLGAVNSLYAMVDSRRRELATLRAIGFESGAIVASILCESVLLAIPGALLGCALAWALFNGLAASPFGFSFQLAVTLDLAVLGIGWALAMGLVGGLLPALRAARVPVTAALRAT